MIYDFLHWWSRGKPGYGPSDRERLRHLTALMELNLHTTQELLDLAQKQSTRIDSLLALINGLKAQASAAIDQSSSLADAQTRIDQLFDAMTANEAKLDSVLDAPPPPAGVPDPLSVSSPPPAPPADPVPTTGPAPAPPADPVTTTDPTPAPTVDTPSAPTN